MEGRLRMSFIPCGVAAPHWGAEWSPVGVLEPGEDAGSPPGFGEAEVGEPDEEEDEEGRGYEGYSGAFSSVMVCRAASGGGPRRKEL